MPILYLYLWKFVCFSVCVFVCLSVCVIVIEIHTEPFETTTIHYFDVFLFLREVQ